MRYWGIVPAAGHGSRFAGRQPKQYASIASAPMLEYSVNSLLNHQQIETVIVALRDDDEYWDTCAVSHSDKVRRVVGGETRAISVRRAMDALANVADNNDWVLVHDGARPCLSSLDLRQLITQINDDPIGGLLAIPVTDTVKLIQGKAISRTVDRNGMIRAATPQMFRYAMLRDALDNALNRGEQPGDEAEAMELAGHTVRFVLGAETNIKVSYAADLLLAEAILSMTEKNE